MSTEVAVVTHEPEINSGFALARYVIEQAKPLADLATLYVKGGLVPNALLKCENPTAAAFTILTRGLALGLDPASALASISPIEGKACLSADLMTGLAMKAGTSFEYIQSDATRCKIKWTRGRSSGVVLWTIEDARAANLTGKDNWKKYPTAMLSARAKAAASRQAAPDVLSGCYTPDEIQSGGVDIETVPFVAQPNEPHDEARNVTLGASMPPPITTTAAAPEYGPAPGNGAAVRSDNPMQNSTRNRLMAIATRSGCKGTADVPQPNGPPRPSTTIVLDEALARIIGRPGEDYVPLAELNNAQGLALADELAKRNTADDAGAALGVAG